MDVVAEKLDAINQTLEKILVVMQKPANKVVNALAVFGLFVGALGLVNIIDTILRWATGG